VTMIRSLTLGIAAFATAALLLYIDSAAAII
jgi:hypothetical protein